MKFKLADAVTKTANYSSTRVVLGSAGRRALAKAKALIVTLDITSAERDTGNETYNFYLVTGDGTTEWDVVAFTQIASTGAKQFVARVELHPGFALSNVTSASPGVAAVDPAMLATVTGGTNAIKSLTAGMVRHGPLGDRIGYELVVAGTIATGIVYSLTVQTE